MKIMDESMESEDCTIAATVPPKTKKLKQARLPFQNLTSPSSPNSVATKKRKHMSPSPTTFRSPKIVKITTKENAEQTTKNIEKNSSSNVHENSTKKSVETLDLCPNDSSDEIETKDDEKKPETKNSDKPGAIRKYFQPISRDKIATMKKSENSAKNAMIVLTRCDDVDDGMKIDDVDKPSSSKNDESSNDELAKVLDDSDDDDEDEDVEDVVSKDKTDSSIDDDDDEDEDEDEDEDANSDLDSAKDDAASSTDDDNDETKKSTVKNNEKSTSGNDTIKTPTSNVKNNDETSRKRKLTPKQLEKKMTKSKLREEREKIRLEREKKREEEKLNRLREKETRQREKREKEEAEKELKRKEREQKELKKQMENEQKQKEKERRDKAKEDDRRKREEAKEEEKRRKEEEKLESERKKQKAASTFVSFFVPKKLETKMTDDVKIVKTSNFMPFEVKADMRVAPICRRYLDESEKSKFDELCVNKMDNDHLYVAEIKNVKKENLRKSGKTWPTESKEDDIVVIEEDDVGSCNMVDQNDTAVDKHRAKLLAFAENRRPPYWGTWRKRSSAVTPRRPFSKDNKWFDYEVDSDEEWEEEEPGESLRGSDDEKDEENPDDDEYDVDNEFMVPHGYLSDEEAQADEDEEDMSPETQKLKLKVLGAEFEEERKTQTSKIKPRVIGPIWQRSDNSYPDNIPQKLVDYLMAREAWIREAPIMINQPPSNHQNPTDSTNNQSKTNSTLTGDERRGPKKKKLPTEALPELVKLIHGNPHGLHFLIKEFMTFWNRKQGATDADPLSKSAILKKIREFGKRMACPEEGPMHLKACWWVSENTRKNILGDELLSMPNQWTYALVPRRKNYVEQSEPTEKPEKDEKDGKKIVPLITKFTKKITHEEMKKQLQTMKNLQSTSSSSPSSFAVGSRASASTCKPAKRATLISVGRGEQFPKSTIVDAFAKSTSANLEIKKKLSTTKIDDGQTKSGEEPVVIDLDSDREDLRLNDEEVGEGVISEPDHDRV